MKLIVKSKKKGIFITFKGDGAAKIAATFDAFICRDHLRVHTKENHFSFFVRNEKLSGVLRKLIISVKSIESIEHIELTD